MPSAGIKSDKLVTMRMRLAAFVLCAAVAYGQAPPRQELVVALTNTPTAESVTQMTNVVKAVANVFDVSFDETRTSFTLRAPVNLLGLAEWLLHAMDKPVGWQPSAQESADPSSREYHLQPGGYPADDRAPVARIYYLTNPLTRSDIEILTTARAVGEIQKIAECNGPRILAFRGTATDVALAEWMIRKLDVPAGGEANVFTLPTGDIVRIFYLNPAISRQDLFDITKKIRTTTNILTVFQKISPPAIAVRGNSAVLAQASQIIGAQ
jgi:hypothetical protein